MSEILLTITANVQLISILALLFSMIASELREQGKLDRFPRADAAIGKHVDPVMLISGITAIVIGLVLPVLVVLR